MPEVTTPDPADASDPSERPAAAAAPAATPRRRPVKKRRVRRPPPVRPTIGWREWIELPDLGVDAIKAKIDTGARTSALHAFDIAIFPDDGVETVYFQVHPLQDTGALSIPAAAPLVGWRHVRSSSGHATDRPLIRTTLRWLDHSWPIELTLTNRDEMGFRMLLGRQALRRRAVVDPGRSYLDRDRKRQGADLVAAHRPPRPRRPR